MNNDNLARLRVAGLIFLMVNAVIFGAGLITVLTVPALVVVLVSFVLSPLPAWFIAPMMMQRFIQARRIDFHGGKSAW